MAATKEPGSVNVKEIIESIKTIEMLTSRYKRKRMSTEDYLLHMNESLSKLTSERNYLEYLKHIGQ
jgi:hypothetical protein